MSDSLKVLIVEDSQDNVQLLLRELKKGGFTLIHKVVNSLKSLEEALEKQKWDMVISGCCLPRFSGMEAYAKVALRNPDIPFIVVADTIEKETAEELVRLGVCDYIRKSNISRLVPAVTRELREAQIRRSHKLTEKDLIRVKNDLKHLIEERTAELTLINARLEREIEERKQAEEEIRGSHERFKSVLDSLDAFVYVADMDTYEILFVNDYAEQLFGNMVGRPCWQAIQNNSGGPCPFCKNTSLLDNHSTPTGVHTWEYRNEATGRWFLAKDRAIRWVDGRMVRLHIATDITDRKAMEEKIKASLQEKEVLLREVHHRVKNNMQVIISLLKLQSAYSKDELFARMFKDSRNRIRAMALIHEKLYKSRDLARIDFCDYLENLTTDLMRSFGIGGQRITLTKDIAPISFTIDTAIPLGLIINEIMSNALKYAFPDNRRGTVSLSLHVLDNDSYELEISDNGIGLPPGFDYKKTESLGFQLITSLAEQQMNGTLTLDTSHGTGFVITFKEICYSQRI